MSVMIVTSLGDFVMDLFTEDCPITTKNFLKLCRIKYFNGCLFHTIQKDFTAQTGDPTGSGTGGDSIYKFLYGEQARFFNDEIRPNLKHLKMGTIAMASAGKDLNASQFYITLRDGLDYLDEQHTVFGEVAEGHDTLMRINEAYVDEKGRPFKNIRIKHTHVLEDPFEDTPQLTALIPDASPEGKPKEEVDDEVRLEDDWVPMDEEIAPEHLEEYIRTKEAHSRAIVLESIGDIPDAEVKPPDNVLFVCKLNPVTEDEDLNTIFSRFGTVTSAEVIRDYKTGDSLCYAFIEFEDSEACERAYFKMDNALIDDRRIHVDFSQSVSKLWNNFRRKGSKQEKGCFKCGAVDHIARDCPGDSSLPQQKYVLKDDNRQHGGKKNASYDMVFEEDGPNDGVKRHKSDNKPGYKKEYYDRHGGRKDDRDYRESKYDRGHREKRGGDRREDRDLRERKDDMESRKKTDDIVRRDRREEPSIRERDSEADGGRNRREERGHGRSNLKGSDYRHDDKRHDRSEEPSRRRKDSYSDVQKSRREERGDGNRSSRDHTKR